MPEPQMRAADNDREAVARRLSEHMATGRLTVAEYEERVARAYAAKTYGDLAQLTADLPSSRPSPAVDRPRPAPAGACGPWTWAGPWGGPWAHGRTLRAAWASWLTTAVIVLSIWLITSLSSGAFGYFWPIWVIGPWGAVLLAQTLAGGTRTRQHRQDRPHLPV